jgi:hypothetical protein
LSLRNSQRYGELSVGGQPRAEKIVIKEQSTPGRVVSRRTAEGREYIVSKEQSTLGRVVSRRTTEAERIVSKDQSTLGRVVSRRTAEGRECCQ